MAAVILIIAILVSFGAGMFFAAFLIRGELVEMQEELAEFHAKFDMRIPQSWGER